MGFQWFDVTLMFILCYFLLPYVIKCCLHNIDFFVYESILTFLFGTIALIFVVPHEYFYVSCALSFLLGAIVVLFYNLYRLKKETSLESWQNELTNSYYNADYINRLYSFGWKDFLMKSPKFHAINTLEEQINNVITSVEKSIIKKDKKTILNLERFLSRQRYNQARLEDQIQTLEDARQKYHETIEKEKDKEDDQIITFIWGNESTKMNEKKE